MVYGEDKVPGTLLLSGVVGSRAYGLARPGSDTDRLAVFAMPSERWWELIPPAAADLTVVYKAPEPDFTAHEAFKYMWMCLKANPTATELLWLDTHEVRHPLGDQLVDIRSAFLSASRVREAYCNYAARQLEDLCADVNVARAEKHARHMLRLLDQGLHLYRTGTLQVHVDDPYRYLEFGQRVAAGDTDLAHQEMTSFQTRFDRTRTPIPAMYDKKRIGSWFADVRLFFLPEYARA